ncbi:hypothetical protein AU191_05475 [Mycolicibacterium acapulense]|nr:hypothetical protein AU191_05475 [Mycolicibacterium acapulense]
MCAAHRRFLYSTVCHTDVNSVHALAQTTDTEGTEKTVCTNNLGTVTIQQNGPSHSENAPGQAEQQEHSTGCGR